MSRSKARSTVLSPTLVSHSLPHSPSRVARALLFCAVAVFGFALRVYHLNRRPMHTDEAVNAYLVGQVLAGSPFVYDPADRHGPVLIAAAVPIARLSGARTFADLSETELRLTPALAGTLTLLLFLPASEIFGLAPCFIAALLWAASSLPLFYDRYFIHESLLITLTFAFLLTIWRSYSRSSARSAALAGALGALMFACKETALLNLFAAATAGLCMRRMRPERKTQTSPRRAGAIAGVLLFLFVTVIIFTWFGSNWPALRSLTQAPSRLLARAGGEGHQKPFWYFAQLIAESWPGAVVILLAALGALRGFLAHSRPASLPLAIYAVTLTCLYSAIPYKTPWLALNLWLPISLLAGLGVEWIWQLTTRSRPLRSASMFAHAVALTVLAVLIGRETYNRVFVDPAGETNPYAYAHTSDDLLGLPAAVEDAVHRIGLATPTIAVIASDPWPLPWYLRHFPRTGFWKPGQHVPHADIYITSPEAADHYAADLQNLRPEFFGVRPGVLLLLWSSAAN